MAHAGAHVAIGSAQTAFSVTRNSTYHHGSSEMPLPYHIGSQHVNRFSTKTNSNDNSRFLASAPKGRVNVMLNQETNLFLDRIENDRELRPTVVESNKFELISVHKKRSCTGFDSYDGKAQPAASTFGMSYDESENVGDLIHAINAALECTQMTLSLEGVERSTKNKCSLPTASSNINERISFSPRSTNLEPDNTNNSYLKLQNESQLNVILETGGDSFSHAIESTLGPLKSEDVAIALSLQHFSPLSETCETLQI